MDVSLPAAAVEAVQEPPPGISDGLMWRLAWRLLADHVQGADGFCVVCRPHRVFPCPVRFLAMTGLRASTSRRYAGLRRHGAAGRAAVPSKGGAS
jgi:hypothetical protein